MFMVVIYVLCGLHKRVPSYIFPHCVFQARLQREKYLRKQGSKQVRKIYNMDIYTSYRAAQWSMYLITPIKHTNHK